ncbi:MAG: UDP-N-acetylmuramoyl-L-alanine--D-glutamate ligase [Bacteroidota bacterium]
MTKRLVILGSGESGVGAAVLAKKKGFEVFVTDNGKIKKQYKQVLSNNEIEFEEGKHTGSLILNADEIVKSPGISDKARMVEKIKKKKISVISEIEFASRYTNAKLIGITGTNGKTTTTNLVYHILKNAGTNVRIAGNVGKSFAMQVAEEDGIKYNGIEYKEHTSIPKYYVLELSSFQLDGMFKTRINVAILTNITTDHMDRYNYCMQNYINSKFRIVQNQTQEDAFIYCADDEIITRGIKKKKISAKFFPFSIKRKLKTGAYIDNGKLNINLFPEKIGSKTPFNMFVEELALQGKHNWYNFMAAGTAARFVDIRKSVIRESLSDFQNIEHRLEYVANVHDVDFINDSKATNVNSAWYALESMQHPVVWIVGGEDEGNDYDMLKDLVKQKVKAIVCLGINNKKIIRAFSKLVPIIVETKSANEAVQVSFSIAKKGDTVLLSPCCKSFDLFRNYEDRGRKFKRAVKSL